MLFNHELLIVQPNGYIFHTMHLKPEFDSHAFLLLQQSRSQNGQMNFLISWCEDGFNHC